MNGRKRQRERGRIEIKKHPDGYGSNKSQFPHCCCFCWAGNFLGCNRLRLYIVWKSYINNFGNIGRVDEMQRGVLCSYYYELSLLLLLFICLLFCVRCSFLDRSLPQYKQSNYSTCVPSINMLNIVFPLFIFILNTVIFGRKCPQFTQFC